MDLFLVQEILNLSKTEHSANAKEHYIVSFISYT